MISVILYGRNDSYGYNLHKRGAISFNCVAEVLSHPDDEIIFVDTNTPDDLPTFPEAIRDTLTDRAKKLLRVLRVRPASYEKFKNGTRMKVLEPLCRNVGIRRANPRNRWILNSNTDMVFVAAKPGRSLSDAVADLPDGLYELPRFEMPEMLWESLDRANPQLIIEQFRHWGRRLHLNESVLGNRENVFDGPGDFQLAPRSQLFAIQGMNEQMVLGWHVDSNLCRRLFLLNGTTHSLLDRYQAYHCDHTRVNTMMHTAEGGTANDTRRFVYEVTSPYLPEQAETWGMPHEPVEEIRLTDKQASRYRDVIEQLLPGLQEPMLQSALIGEAFNHGLLYDNQHVLPYLTDHLSQIPPTADVGYFGGNAGLLKLVAGFRGGFGHTGRLLYDPVALETGGGRDGAGLPANCAALGVDAIYDQAFVLCLDLWMGNFAVAKNTCGFTVPKPSIEACRFGGLMMRRLHDLARREKARYDASPHQTKKFLLIGTQNTWFEGAATQLISVVLTPYSSYVRHGVVRKDAFARPFQPVPGHCLLLGENNGDLQKVAEQTVGTSALAFDFATGWVHSNAVRHGLLDITSVSARKALLDTETGRRITRLQAALAEVDGQLEIADKMLRAVDNAGQAANPSAALAAAVPEPPPKPSARLLAGAPAVGVDIRILCDPDAARGTTGSFTRLHLEQLARALPNWKFQLYQDHATPPPAAAALLALPNVKLRRYADYKPGEIDLFHIPAPFHLSGRHASPLQLVPGVKTSAMLHDLECLRFNREELKLSDQLEFIQRLEQLLDPRFRLLTLSEFTRSEFMKATGAGADKAAAVLAGMFHAANPNPISSATVRAVREKYGLKQRMILHIGAVETCHNFESVVGAFGHLRSRDVDLVVVGEKTRFMKQLSDFVRERKVARIVFPGPIPDTDLQALYQEAAGLICLSPLMDFAFPVLDAMAQGCPVIAANDACFPELCGDAALLFPPKDVKAIGRALEQLLSSAPFHREAARKCRARASQFTWEATARKTIAVWEQMLAIGANSEKPVLTGGAMFGVPPSGGPHPAPPNGGTPNSEGAFILDRVAGAPASETSLAPAGTASEAVKLDATTSRVTTESSGAANATVAKPEPLVSAIVSAYNSIRFLRGCLEDLERQTIADRLEIVVVDSASPQDERSIVEEFQGRYSNIVYIRSQERETVYGAWNRGIKAARGKYITNANTDDRHRPDALEILARTLDQNREISLVYADCLVTRTENETFENAHVVSRFQWLDFNPADLLLKGCFVGPQPMWRREVHEEHGYFDHTFVSAGDYEFWLRLATTRKFLHVQETLGLYLESPTSVEHSNRERGVKEDLEARRRHGPAIVPGHVPAQPGASSAGAMVRATQKPAAITLPPCALIGHLARARDLMRAKKYRDAWTAALAAIQARPFHPEAFLLLAEIARAAGDSDSARRCAQRAREMAPKWQPAQKFLKSNLRGNTNYLWLTLPDSIRADAKPRVSLCMIVKNEEPFLGQCLSSVRGLVDQIVVVDTGSTDRTVEIAREHGAEVHQFKWCDDFSAARNAALEHATGDWILVLDADEELPPGSHDAFRRLLQDASAMAWRLPLVDTGREEEGCCYVPRLFRNAPALFYVSRIHEQIFSSLEVRRAEWGLENGFGDAALRHHGYRPEIVKDRNKIERNLRLLELALKDLPGEPNLLMNYGLELVRSGQATRGIAAYREAFAAMSAQPASEIAPETRESLLTQFCTQLMGLGQFSEIVSVLNSPLAREAGLTASLHFALGLAHLELKQSGEAAHQMRQCLDKRDQPCLAPINKEIRKAGPRHCLALALLQIGDADGATQEFRNALQDDPQSRPARLDYARFLAARNGAAEALKILFALATEKPDDAQAWLAGGQAVLTSPALLDTGRKWTAEARRCLPQNTAILRQRAEVLTLSGMCEAALPLWRQLMQATSQPDTVAALVLCETVAGENRFSPTEDSEASISREFLKWYRRLVKFQAGAALTELNARIDSWQPLLPSAARVLGEALAESREAIPA